MTTALRYLLGVDLGKLTNYSALVVCQYAGDPATAPLEFVHLERPELRTPYAAVVARIVELAATPPLAGAVEVVVDATGVGEPVLEMLRASTIEAPLYPVVLAGPETAPHYDRLTGRWVVSKADLIESLEVTAHADRLLVTPELPLAGVFRGEIGGTTMRLGQAGRPTFTHDDPDDPSSHGDLMIAAALCCWVAAKLAGAQGVHWYHA